MRSLAAGEKGYEDFPKLMKSKFVFLNVYCNSVKEEHEPRGPDGPYQFVDKSVPVYVIKNWEGKTFKQQLGYGSGDRATKDLGKFIKDAVQKNGAISPPKNLLALTKIWNKAEASFAKKRPGYAWKDLEKLVVLAQDKKKFKDGFPSIGRKAKEKIAEVEAAFTKELDAAVSLGANDPAAAAKSIKKMMRRYSMVKSAKKRMNEELKNLPKPSKG